MNTRGLVRALAVLGLISWAPASAQIEVADLEIEEPVISSELERYYQEAETMFGTVEQADSIPLFTRVIESLQPLAGAGEEVIDARLRDSLLYRARALHNFGEIPAAQADLVSLISNGPGFEMDRDEVSSRFVELFDEIRGGLIGFVEFLIQPPDTLLSIQGRPFESIEGPQPILAGPYVAEARRPGYHPLSLGFEVEAGETLPVKAELERSSAAIAIRTRPSGVMISIDGRDRGATFGEAESVFMPTGPAASYPRSDFSTELWLGDVQIGQHRIEARLPGFRTYRGRLDVSEQRDFQLEPLILERETGTALLHGLPADAEVLVNDQPLRPDHSGPAPRLELPPGAYSLSVRRGTYGVFETRFDLADRQTVEVQIRIRPALVLLGILGKDEVASRRLRTGIEDEFQRLGNWTLVDRTMSATEVLPDLGLVTDRLRAMAQSGDRTGSIDWSAVQTQLDAALPGSVYLLGVLSDDLVADAAHLWIWSAAPGPARPELRQISLQNNDAITRLARAFVPQLSRVKPVLGALIIDSTLGNGPVIAAVEEGGPAESAGLAVGNQITALAGVPIFSSAQLRQEIDKLGAGETTEIEFQSAGETSTVRLQLGQSYTVVDLSDPDVVYPALSAALNAELERESQWPRWVLQLNRAGVLLRSKDHEGAVRELRELEGTAVPPLDQPGMGRAHLDYWLGLALVQAGARYTDSAREAFGRAASAERGRLHSDDGSYVAPRARARLGRLGGSR